MMWKKDIQRTGEKFKRTGSWEPLRKTTQEWQHRNVMKTPWLQLLYVEIDYKVLQILFVQNLQILYVVPSHVCKF